MTGRLGLKKEDFLSFGETTLHSKCPLSESSPDVHHAPERLMKELPFPASTLIFPGSLIYRVAVRESICPPAPEKGNGPVCKLMQSVTANRYLDANLRELQRRASEVKVYK